jgi:hypothetical protein
MKDINQPVRKAFYARLNGQLSYDGSNVPVCDETLIESISNNNYVILGSQSDTGDSTKSSNDRHANITLDIVTKQGQSATKDIADNIADQILTLLFTTPHVHTLPVQSGFQFLNLTLQSSNDIRLSLLPAQNVYRRILTFSLRVVY